MDRKGKSSNILAVVRVRFWFSLLVLVISVFIVKLFYLQVIRYSYYHQAALSDQQKQYQIAPTRGIIEAQGPGGQLIPIVLNQVLYTLYADPTLVKNASNDAIDISKVIGGNASDYQTLLLTKGTRYVIIKHKITEAQSKAILAYQLPGVGTQGQDYRTYPQGTLAAQVLGFVNDNGTGEYGIEQALNQKLAGTPGELKAVTDINGVPLVASKNNISTAPVNGQNVALTINISMQKQLEEILQQGLKNAKSGAGSALIIDTNTGQINAMANFPSYDPGNYTTVTDASLFNNASVSNPIEIGSTMKTLTTSAALNLGVIQQNTTYYDPAQWTIDGFKITNIEQDGGPGTRSIGDILNLSLNTGATWMLMQMGGGQVNQTAREKWYDYMTNHFRLGQNTGIEQGYESPGYIPKPNIDQEGDQQQNLAYANTAFGQAVTVTPLQLGAAVSSVLNGGAYYQPTLVSQTIDPNGKVSTNQPKVLEKNVVSAKTGQSLIPLMEFVVQQHYLAGFSDLNFPSNYIVGGKTGTAQIANPAGGYFNNIFNGTYVGFVGGDTPQYTIVVFVIKPNVAGYAGANAAQPIFASLVHMLINQAYVNPKSH